MAEIIALINDLFEISQSLNYNQSLPIILACD
jgi:hypothetical protein